MILYHGTSDKFKAIILKKGLLPPSRTNTTNENRSINLSKVYLTDDVDLARVYAERAVDKHGGDPLIFIVDCEAYKDRPRQYVLYQANRIKASNLI